MKIFVSFAHFDFPKNGIHSGTLIHKPTQFWLVRHKRVKPAGVLSVCLRMPLYFAVLIDAHARCSSLNGANGEYTNSDDVEPRTCPICYLDMTPYVNGRERAALTQFRFTCNHYSCSACVSNLCVITWNRSDNVLSPIQCPECRAYTHVPPAFPDARFLRNEVRLNPRLAVGRPALARLTPEHRAERELVTNARPRSTPVLPVEPNPARNPRVAPPLPEVGPRVGIPPGDHGPPGPPSEVSEGTEAEIAYTEERRLYTKQNISDFVYQYLFDFLLWALLFLHIFPIAILTFTECYNGYLRLNTSQWKFTPTTLEDIREWEYQHKTFPYIFDPPMQVSDPFGFTTWNEWPGMKGELVELTWLDVLIDGFGKYVRKLTFADVDLSRWITCLITSQLILSVLVGWRTRSIESIRQTEGLARHRGWTCLSRSFHRAVCFLLRMDGRFLQDVLGDEYVNHITMYGHDLDISDPTGHYRGYYMAQVLVNVAHKVLLSRIASSIGSRDLLRYISGEVNKMSPSGTDPTLVHNTSVFVYQTVIRQRYMESSVNIGSSESPQDIRY